MKVSKNDIDKLNSVLSVVIEKTDYESKVEEVLKDYKKRANIPGFRKGHTPIGLIKKQYGISVKVDEINKLMQKGLGDYLGEKKLDISEYVEATPITINRNPVHLMLNPNTFNEKDIKSLNKAILQSTNEINN